MSQEIEYGPEVKAAGTRVKEAMKKVKEMKKALKDNTSPVLEPTIQSGIATAETELVQANVFYDKMKRTWESQNKDWSSFYEEYPILKSVWSNTQQQGKGKISINKGSLIKDGMASGAITSIAMQGPTGTGKTTTFQQIGNQIGRPVFSINASSNMEEEELVGKFTIIDGKPVFQPGLLITAMKVGAMFVIEEVNYAKPGVIGKLNQLLDKTRQVVVPELDDPVVKAHPDFIMGVTFNNGYAGTRSINRAFINRFNITIDIPQLTEATLTSRMKHVFPDLSDMEAQIAWWFFSSVVYIIKDNQFDADISQRQTEALINLIRLENGGAYDTPVPNFNFKFAYDAAVVNQVSVYDEDVKGKLDSLWSTFTSTSWDSKKGTWKTNPKGAPHTKPYGLGVSGDDDLDKLVNALNKGER